MRVLVAPDKFRGSMAAETVRGEMEAGLRAAGLKPIGLAVADGGEGTASALLAARGGAAVRHRALDPLGRAVDAEFALLEGGETAVVEVAAASGLDRLRGEEPDAEAASTRGTGELMAAAVEAGARTLLVAAGGSATSDGGRGALEALGADFSAEPPRVERAFEALEGARLVVLCDVSAPLVGEAGAARTFAPQKGADAGAVQRLERRLERWGALAARHTGRDPRPMPMAGAAGGLAGGFAAFLNAELRSGARFVLEAIEFDRRLAESEAVITGEGRIDAQTLTGKIVGEIALSCRRSGVRCLALVGADALPPELDPGCEVRVVAPGRVASASDVRIAARAVGAELLGRG